MSHRNVQPHVSIHAVACYRTGWNTDEVRRPPSDQGVGAPPLISVLESRKTKWMSHQCHESTSSNNSCYTYFKVSPRKKDSILFRIDGGSFFTLCNDE